MPTQACSAVKLTQNVVYCKYVNFMPLLASVLHGAANIPYVYCRIHTSMRAQGWLLFAVAYCFIQARWYVAGFKIDLFDYLFVLKGCRHTPALPHFLVLMRIDILGFKVNRQAMFL